MDLTRRGTVGDGTVTTSTLPSPGYNRRHYMRQRATPIYSCADACPWCTSSTVDNPYAQRQHMARYTQSEHIIVHLPIIDVRMTECARGDNGTRRHRDIALIRSRSFCLSMEQVIHGTICLAAGEVRRDPWIGLARTSARRATKWIFTL
jgi:hypothetical protein